jgi:hypothetical protein
MGKRVEKTNYLVNGVNVEQRLTDGFINGTSMALAHEKKINDWFRTNDTLELFQSLMDGLGLQTNYGKSRNLEAARLSASKYAEMFPGLVFTKSGSPELGGGTWLHPDLAIQLAQWCNKPFALQVSRWVREWMTSAYNPSRLELDKDRIAMRDEVKDVKRIALMDQVKSFLQKAGQYNPGSKETGLFFGSVHNEVNLVITGEKAIDMRARLEGYLGHKVHDQELLRDYFPIIDLANYGAICQAAANNMEQGIDPINAVRLAAKQVLSSSYIPKPIDFTEKIVLVRNRVSLVLTKQNNPPLF